MSDISLIREELQAVKLADRVLDRPNADPDDDLATLARHFLRMRESFLNVAWIADTMLENWLDYPASDLDGGEQQDWLQHAELIEPAIYDPEKHGHIDDVEPGEECLVLTDKGKVLQRVMAQTRSASADGSK